MFEKSFREECLTKEHLSIHKEESSSINDVCSLKYSLVVELLHFLERKTTL